MTSRKKYIPLLLAVMIAGAAGLSCGMEVPIREMAGAKMSITRALEVKADRYAAEELNKSQELLKASHNQIADEKADAAKELALKSSEESQKAIDKSLPLLSADSLTETKKIYMEAELLFAEKYASGPFAGAGKLIGESESLHGEKKFWDSHLKSKEGLSLAEEARDVSLRNVPAVKEEIAGLEKQADDMASKRGADFAASEIGSAKEKLKLAGGKADEKNLKEAHSLMDEAKTLLGAAQQGTLMGISREKLDAVEKALSAAKGSGLKSSFDADLVRAEGLVDQGRGFHEAKSYNESIAKSDEALGLLNTVTLSMTSMENEMKEEAQGKLIRARELLEEKNKSEVIKSKNEIELGKAAGHVETAGGLFGDKDYTGTIRESDNALAILGPLVVSDLEGGTGDIAYGQEPMIYTVKYNPRDRDCLWKIALNTYRDARLWPLIYVANKDKIRDPDLIFPGQKFIIPAIPKRGESIREEKAPVTNSDLKKDVMKDEGKDAKSDVAPKQ